MPPTNQSGHSIWHLVVGLGVVGIVIVVFVVVLVLLAIFLGGGVGGRMGR